MGGLGQGAVYLLFRTLLLLAGIAFAIPGTKGFLVWLFEKVICYRVQVVKANLMLAFPGKTTEEIHRISSDFYRHFVDLISQQRQGRGHRVWNEIRDEIGRRQSRDGRGFQSPPPGSLLGRCR